MRSKVSFSEFFELLAWYPTPDERADVMIRHAGYSGVEKLLERFPESRLEAYGVNCGTLEAAVERAKNSE